MNIISQYYPILAVYHPFRLYTCSFTPLISDSLEKYIVEAEIRLDNLSHVEKFLVDGGYSGERFANQVKDICGAQVEVVKRSELHKFVFQNASWITAIAFPISGYRPPKAF